MELTVRDWMVIVGVLLIAAVALDAWRRIRSDKYSRVAMKLVDPEQLPSEGSDDITWLKELPNGGARIVERSDLERVAAEQDQRAAAIEDDPQIITGITSQDTHDGEEDIDWVGDAQASTGRETRPSEPPPAGKLPRQVDPEVFMLNVQARSPGGFRGEDIMHILLACDLRFGDMSFFHRHEFEAGRGAIQFSVANMMQPGVFDIDNMTDMTTPGLVFFLTLPGPEDMMQAFDYMLETAQAVARNLGGDVLDESRSVLTPQTLEHSRQKIRDLERCLLAKAR